MHLTEIEVVTLPVLSPLAPLSSASLEKVLFPLLFSALKVIVIALPYANTLSEVQVFIAVEPLKVLTLSGSPHKSHKGHLCAYGNLSVKL